MNSQFAGTPRKCVIPIAGSVRRRKVSSGTKLWTMTLVPPKWNAGLAKTLRPPVWNNGSTTRLTMSGPVSKNSTWLTAFQNVMPWVMIAPFGRPVVPDVYITVSTVSNVLSGRGSAPVALWSSSS